MPIEFSTDSSINLSSGRYLLEVWGAQGGNCIDQTKSRGGYSSGIITHKSITIFLSLYR
jgi:hypothetical protein